MTFILPSFGASAISAVPASGGGGSGGWSGNSYALSLDGLDDYVEVADSDDFSFGDGSSNSAFSYSFWVRVERSSTNVFQHLISKGSSSNSEYLIQAMPPNSYGLNADSIYFALYAGSTSGAVVESPASSISLNTWHHVVCTADGTGNRSGMKIYIDGVSQTLTTSGLTSLTMINSTDPLRFGARSQSSAPNSFLQGKMDEIALFNSELSSSNVTSIYNSGGPDDLASLSPVGWWRMGDNDGGTGTTITDQGSGSNDGTLGGGPTFSTDVPVGPLTNTYSLSLDGTDDYVALGNSSDLAPSNITVSLWFKASGTVGTFNYLFAREGALYGSYLLRYTSANKFNIFIGHAGGSTTDITSSSTYTLTDWHHVAFTYDQTNLKLYVDGSEAASVAKTTAIDYTPSTSYGTDNTYIGKGTFADNTEGLIDEVAIFNSALSASDITSIYNSGTPDDLSSYSPVGWWRMGDNDSGTGTTITDQGSGGNDGTIENGSSGNTSPAYSTDVP
jgi:hypothetical protein